MKEIVVIHKCARPEKKRVPVIKGTTITPTKEMMASGVDIEVIDTGCTGQCARCRFLRIERVEVL